MKMYDYLESTEQLRNRPRKFGFRINVKDEKTGEITSSFILNAKENPLL